MNKTITLNSGFKIPLIGCKINQLNVRIEKLRFFFVVFLVGTFQITGSDLIKQVLDLALTAGYRHFGKFDFLSIFEEFS